MIAILPSQTTLYVLDTTRHFQESANPHYDAFHFFQPSQMLKLSPTNTNALPTIDSASLPIDGKLGQGKRDYGLNSIQAKTAHTSEAGIHSIFLVMNLGILH